MSMKIFSSLPLKSIVALATLCFIVPALLPSSGIASMTVEEERKLGDKLALEIQHNLDMVNDPLVKDYVDEVGRRIEEQAHDGRFRYRFYMFKEEEPNAFAIPGGHIFISSGLIRLVDTEDELAGVIGHETGHSVMRHIDKAMDRAKRLSLLTLAAIIAGGILSKNANGTGALTAGAMAMAQSLMLKYSRENEYEADQKGIQYLAEAGYDPQGMVNFLKKIARWERYTSPEIPTYLSDHPGTDERIAYLSDTSTTLPKPLRAHPPAAGDLEKIKIRLSLGEMGGVEGISQFSSLLGEKPRDVDALYGLGMSYAMVGRTKEAISYLSEALKVSPKDAYILRELGMAYFQAQEVDKALDLLQDAIQTFPHDTSILYYLAQGSEEKGRWDDALSFYQRALESDPKRVEIFYNLGVVYEKKGLLGLSHENFGLYFKEKGQQEAALFHLRKALEYTRDRNKREHLEELIKECEGKKKKPSVKTSLSVFG
jgi:predicted Zn-dependent protease